MLQKFGLQTGAKLGQHPTQLNIISSGSVRSGSELGILSNMASSEDAGKGICEIWAMFTSSARPGRSSTRQSCSHIGICACRRPHRTIVRFLAARYAQATRVSRATRHGHCINSYVFKRWGVITNDDTTNAHAHANNRLVRI